MLTLVLRDYYFKTFCFGLVINDLCLTLRGKKSTLPSTGEDHSAHRPKLLCSHVLVLIKRVSRAVVFFSVGDRRLIVFLRLSSHDWKQMHFIAH